MWVWHQWQDSQGQGIWLGQLCSGVDPTQCFISAVKAVAGSWSGWCQIGTLTSLKAKSYLRLPASYLKEYLGLVTLSNGFISPRISFWSRRWAGSAIIWRFTPKISCNNQPVPEKALSTMSKAAVNIPLLALQLHMEFVCSVIALWVLQLTSAVLFALQPRSFLSVHFSEFLSLWLYSMQCLFRDDLLE